MKAPDKSKTRPGKLCARGHDDGGGKSLRYLNGGACFTCVQENRRSRGGKVARAPKPKAGAKVDPSIATLPRTAPTRAAKAARPSKSSGGLVGIVADLCSDMTLAAFAERMGISTERAIELIVRGLDGDASVSKGGGDAGGTPAGRTPPAGKGPGTTRGAVGGTAGTGARSSSPAPGSQLRRIYDDLELDDEPMPSTADLDEIEQDEPELSDDEDTKPAEACARTRTRARTIAMKRLTKEELRIGALLWPERPQHPATRADCPPIRPCPYVSCRYHLYLDVDDTGSIKVYRPDIEPWQLEQSCALDLADAGASSLEQVGRTLNLTRERVRQIEADLFRKLRRRHGDLLRELLASAAELTPGESLGDRMELS